jgi:hypothetical protein
MQKTTKLQWVMGLTLGLLLGSCSVSQRYHNRGLNIQWRLGGKQVSTAVKVAAPKATLDHTYVKETETIAGVIAKREVIPLSSDKSTVPQVAVDPSFPMTVFKSKLHPIQEFQRAVVPPTTYENPKKYHRMANKSVVYALLSLTPFILIFLFQLLSIYYGVKALKHIPTGHRDRKNAYTGIALSVFLVAVAICFWLLAAGWSR